METETPWGSHWRTQARDSNAPPSHCSGDAEKWRNLSNFCEISWVWGGGKGAMDGSKVHPVLEHKSLNTLSPAIFMQLGQNECKRKRMVKKRLPWAVCLQEGGWLLWLVLYFLYKLSVYFSKTSCIWEFSLMFAPLAYLLIYLIPKKKGGAHKIVYNFPQKIFCFLSEKNPL